MNYDAYTENRRKSEREVVREYMRLAQHEPRLLDLLNEIMAAQFQPKPRHPR